MFAHSGNNAKQSKSKNNERIRKQKDEILQVVEETKCDAKEHVDDSQDNGHLHLEGVQERQLVD